MRRMLIRFLPATMAVSFLTAGCASSTTVAVRLPATPQDPKGELVAAQLSPAAQREYSEAVPGADNELRGEHVWVSDYWADLDGRWILIPGHWE